MKHFIYSLTVIFCTTLSSCADQKFSDKNIEAQALIISQRFDANSIKIFHEWNFFERGGDNWEKISCDTTLYICRYNKIADTTVLVISQADKFVIDFPCSFEFDTSKYWRFELANFNDTLVRIIGVDKNGRDIVLSHKSSLSSLFVKSNPFEKFSSLSSLKDSLNVFGITYFCEMGGIVQFHLSYEHILTFLPDNANLKLKDAWINELATGKTFLRNWNLRKVNTQP